MAWAPYVELMMRIMGQNARTVGSARVPELFLTCAARGVTLVPVGANTSTRNRFQSLAEERQFMANAKYVSVKCDDKVSVPAIKKDGVIKAMTATITAAINGKSSGKLTTTTKSNDGYVLTANVVSLKCEPKDKPTQLDGVVDLTIMEVGAGGAKVFIGSGKGSAKGISKIQADAEALVSGIYDDLMKKAIAKM
jgi:hypothetical protein